ncbi:MAG: hypothetical protein ACK6BG_01005 [Cyanobacteriota bacterium]
MPLDQATLVLGFQHKMTIHRNQNFSADWQQNILWWRHGELSVFSRKGQVAGALLAAREASAFC